MFLDTIEVIDLDGGTPTGECIHPSWDSTVGNVHRDSPLGSAKYKSGS